MVKYLNVILIVFCLYFVDKKEVKGVDYDFISRIDLLKIDVEKKLFLYERNVGYYICGLLDFMYFVEVFLKNVGVDEMRIYMEVFNIGGFD